jgi:hypothetical protein
MIAIPEFCITTTKTSKTRTETRLDGVPPSSLSRMARRDAVSAPVDVLELLPCCRDSLPAIVEVAEIISVVVERWRRAPLLVNLVLAIFWWLLWVPVDVVLISHGG